MSKAAEAGVNLEFINDQLLPALRSGEYIQAFGALRTGDMTQKRMCCLGVACDVRIPTAWKKKITKNIVTYTHILGNSNGLLLENSRWLLGDFPQGILAATNDMETDLENEYTSTIKVLENIENDAFFDELMRVDTLAHSDKVYGDIQTLLDRLQNGEFTKEVQS